MVLFASFGESTFIGATTYKGNPVSNNTTVRKLQNALLLPTIALGASLGYTFSVRYITQLLNVNDGVTVTILGTIIPLILTTLSIWLTARTREVASGYLAATDAEQKALAKSANSFAKFINIAAIVVAGTVGLVSGIASATTGSFGNSVAGVQPVFTISFVLSLAVLYFGIRLTIQKKNTDASAQPAPTEEAAQAEASVADAEAAPAAKVSKSSAINALMIPVFAFIVVPVISAQILSATGGQGGQWVLDGALVAIAASLFFGARLLAQAGQVRDENGKRLGGVSIARQWIFALSLVYLFFGYQFTLSSSVVGGIQYYGDVQTSTLVQLLGLLEVLVVLTAMLAANHFVLVYRAKTPQK